MKIIYGLFLYFFTLIALAQPVKSPKGVSPEKRAKIQSLLDSYTAKGIPGLSLAVKNNTDEWTNASGFAQVESQTLLTTGHLMFAQSVSKTYMATAIMLLKEQNKIHLDSTIQAYLPARLLSWIPQTGKITVRMLLNHTSGLHDYAYDSEYVNFLINEQKTVISPETILAFAFAKPSRHAPGEKYEYSNTNYVLLALIADHLTGDHRKFIQTSIHARLGLRNTYYKEENYLNSPLVPDTYIDFAENGELKNVTGLQKLNVQSMIGDDGHVATPLDYVRFMEALFKGRLLKKETLAEMMSYTGRHPTYGLGLAKVEKKGIVGYGHSGAGTGAGCILYHFPEKDLTLFLGTNFSTLRNGPHSSMAYQVMDELFTILFKE
jgi:D-alanyl-D-alanine carboxypeptidase